MLAATAGRSEEGIAALSRALEARPGFNEARRSRAVLLARKCDWEHAGQDINWCLEREPTSADTLYAAACVAAIAAEASPSPRAVGQALELLRRALEYGVPARPRRRRSRPDRHPPRPQVCVADVTVCNVRAPRDARSGDSLIASRALPSLYHTFSEPLTMVFAKAPAPDEAHSSWIKQMRSIAIILREEFGVAFCFYDAATGNPLEGMASEPRPGAPRTTTVSTAESPTAFDQTSAARLADEGVAQVQSLQGARYQLALPFADAGRPPTIAVGVIAGMARTPAEILQEQARLSKWLLAVHLRLHAASQCGAHQRHRHGSGPGAASLVGLEALMGLEHLLRSQRIDEPPERNRRQVLETAAKVLRVQTLLWVRTEDDEALIEGEPLLSPRDCGQLLRLLAEDPDGGRAGYLLNNQVQATRWGARFPKLATLLAIPVPVKSGATWVIALNKSASTGSPGSSRGSSGSGPTGEAAFHRTDAALLLPFAALLAVQLRAARRHQQSNELVVGLTRSLAAAVDVRDTYSSGHSERIARIAVELARELGLQEKELGDVYLSGLLHDVGKIGLCESILRKSTPLTPGESSHLRQHVSIGSHLLSALPSIAHLLPAVLHHHERCDGTGYPHGLKGESIPLLARILAVAESYDAITTFPYQDGETPRETVEETLSQGANLQWDGRVVAAFFRCRDRIRAIHHCGLGHSLDAALRTTADDDHEQPYAAPACA